MVHTRPTNTLLLRKKNKCSGCTYPGHYMCKYLLQKCFEHNHFSTRSTNQALGSNSKPNKGGEIVFYYKTIKDLHGTWKSLFPRTPADWKELLALFLTALTLSWPLSFLLFKHYSHPLHNRVTNGIPLPASSASDNKTNPLY